MKWTFYLLVLMSAVIIASVAGETHAEPGGLVGEPFKMMDANGDEKISQREYVGRKTGEEKARAKRQFRSLDKDDDNTLGRKEYEEQRGLWNRRRSGESSRER